MRSTNAIRQVVFATVLWFGVAAPAVAQSVGAIAGTIVDSSGAVLPGVTVTLSGQGVIGGEQTGVTEARGAYQFTRLVPGSYSVKAELPGFSTAVQPNISVNADQTSRVDLKLSVGDLAETITVSGAPPVLDTTSALHQTVMSREVMDTLPTAVDIYSIGRLAPAVTESKIDVGGKEMIAQSTQYVHGSTQDDNGLQYDGMSISHYNTGNGGSVNYYLDTFQAEQVNYKTGQTPAEEPVGGVIVNVVTRTGSNTLHGQGMYSWTTQGLQSSNVSPELRTQLLAGVPPAALAANPDITPAARIDALFDSAVALGGPILRDRLWFMGELKYGQSNIYKVGSYNSDGTQLLSDNTLKDYFGKLSWAVGKNTQLHYFSTYQLKGRYHVAGGPTVTQFFETQSANYNPSENVINLIKWTSVLGPHTVIDIAGNAMNGQNNSFPQPQVPDDAIAHYDTVSRTFTTAQGRYTVDNGWVAELAASLTQTAGAHDIKVGYQMFQDRHVAGAISTSNMLANYANGVPVSVSTYNTNGFDTSFWPIVRNRDHALYVQDKWAATNKLTLSLGLRFQTGFSWFDVQPGAPDGGDATPLCQVATSFIAAQCYPGPANVPHWKNIAPRFSAIYDLSGSGVSVVKFTANRYEIPQGNTMAARVNPIGVQNDNRPWTVCAAGQTSGCDLNADLLPQLNELGPSTGFALGTTNRYADDVKPPYSDEYAADFQQQILGDLVIGAGYYYRTHKNNIGVRNLAVPTSGYVPLNVTEVSSGQQVTVYNQAPATRGKFDNVYTNDSALDATFKGVDFTATKRMARGWMLMGNLSVGKNVGDIYGTTDLNNPNYTFRHGLLDNDQKVFLKVSGAYELPYGITAAANVQHYSGYPELTTVQIDSKTVKLTQVSQSLVVQSSGTIRQPGATIADLDFKKSLKLGQFTISPRIDIFNLLNTSGIQTYIAQLGPSYGNPITIIDGRLIKFGVNASW